jgi:anti-sigma factor ChrR (cupin superfamily)
VVFAGLDDKERWLEKIQDKAGMLNMDRALRLAIETRAMQWEDSPSVGVVRKKLEREAAESGQVTSIVRYQAGSQFRPHPHPYGEEIFVLHGVFEDEHQQYPAGTYLRNPPGTQHAPGSKSGCDLLVKLNMFDPEDLQPVCIQTNTAEWFPGLVPGLSVMPLHSFKTEHTALVRWAPDTLFNPHVHPGGEEIFVLSGVFEDEQGTYPQGTWLRNPPYSQHRPLSRGGCIIFVKTGHMPA